MDHVRNGKNGDYSNNKVDSRSSQVLEEIRHAEAVQTLQRAKIEAVRINKNSSKIVQTVKKRNSGNIDNLIC